MMGDSAGERKPSNLAPTTPTRPAPSPLAELAGGSRTPAPQSQHASLAEQEKRLEKMYGKLPAKKDILNQRFKERKYFDSGDYALSKAGRQAEVGTSHPSPERIPHQASHPQANMAHPQIPGQHQLQNDIKPAPSDDFEPMDTTPTGPVKQATSKTVDKPSSRDLSRT